MVVAYAVVTIRNRKPRSRPSSPDQELTEESESTTETSEVSEGLLPTGGSAPLMDDTADSQSDGGGNLFPDSSNSGGGGLIPDDDNSGGGGGGLLP